MTYPFENDTSAIIKKLANGSIKSDKRSKMFLLLTITLSVCIAFSILLISAGTQEEYKNTQRNKAQVGILGITDEQAELLQQKGDVLWIGKHSDIGLFYQDNKTITVSYGNEDYFLNQEEKLFQGHVPQNKDEIMLPQNYIDFAGETYQIGDTITLDLTGTGQDTKYTLSGILNDTKESNGYHIYVSKELARNLSDDTIQVTAYIRLNMDVVNSTEILEFAAKVIQDTGIEEGQINLTEYFAVMSGAIKAGVPIPVPLLAAITAVLAATIIYGVFYTKITKNVQMFGQLRTIGMTKTQIKKMAKREGLHYASAGIPLGLVIGALIGFLVCPAGFRLETAIFYAAINVVAAFAVVNIAIFKPVRVAMNTSPVEGSKYISYTGSVKDSQKLYRELTPLGLAEINLHRNSRKAFFTLLMLGLSGVFLLVTAAVAGSIDPKKQAAFKYYPDGNILLQLKNTLGSSFAKEAEPYGSSKLQLEENPLECEQLKQKLETIEGIEKITESNCIYMTITLPGGSGSITSITDFFPTLNRDQLAKVQPIISSGTANYDDMFERNEILVEEDTAKVGDTLKIAGRSFDGSAFEIQAAVAGTYNRADLMEHSPVIPGSPYFIMTYDTAEKLTGITEQTGILALTVSDNNFETVLSAISEIADRNGKIEVNTIEQTIASIQNYYSPTIKTFYMISAILFIFGGVSLTNMLMVDLQNRKHEFGLLRAIGTTQKQLKNMLKRELIFYLAGSFFISLLGSTAASIIVCKRLDEVNHCINFSFPWLFLMAFVMLLIVIYFVFSLYASNELKRTDIIGILRE